MVTPCPSCFVTFYQANLYLKEHPQLMAQVNEALAVVNLTYKGNVRVRDLMEVLFNDVTPEVIATKVQRGLNGLKVAPYYGCQMVRPDYGFENPDSPRSLDRIVESLGGEVISFPLKNRCCGGALIISEQNLAVDLMSKLLDNALVNGAECIAAPCPLCQMNLDAYQGIASAHSKLKIEHKLPVLFVTQLIGLALGIDTKSLGLNTNIASPDRLFDHISRVGVKIGT
jgi:heterodisulfide reductase subunit B